MATNWKITCRCGALLTPQEQWTYGHRCEDCWAVATAASFCQVTNYLEAVHTRAATPADTRIIRKAVES